MSQFNRNPVRATASLCTIALLSLGTSGCMMGGMGAMAPEMMQAHSAMHHFNMAVHMGEIEDAQMAMSRSSNPQVQSFAQRMISEHTAAMQREEQMMMAMGMGVGMRGGMGAGMNRAGNAAAGEAGAGMNMDMPRMRAMLMENPHSRPVMEAHMQMMQRMQGLSGMAFDRAYMQNQVAMHRYALENIDRMMAHMGMSPGGGMAHSGAMTGQAGATGATGATGAGGTMRGGMEGMMMMERNNRAMIASHLQMAEQMMGAMGAR
ncbi:MAG: DUF4142 domain-containing protein [Gemmatimonadota bacterium]|nr:DUF4142 domain-containing protein [Gemmatimonadota bacterium]